MVPRHWERGTSGARQRLKLWQDLGAQTVVMSFGRNQSLGKPDLPIITCVFASVQLVHKLVERMDRLRFTDVTPENGKKYRHNSEK